MNLACFEHATASGRLVNSDPRLEGIADGEWDGMRIIEQIVDRLPKVAVQTVDRCDLVAPRVNGAVQAGLPEGKVPMQRRNRLLTLPPDESVHSIQEIYLIVLFHVVILRVQPFRLEEADFLSDQGFSPIHEHKDGDVRSLPASVKRKVPVKVTNPSQPTDVVRVHAYDGTRREKPRGGVRDQGFDQAIIKGGLANVGHIREAFADTSIGFGKDATKPTHHIVWYLRPTVH
jgi:hypothetical protein